MIDMGVLDSVLKLFGGGREHVSLDSAPAPGAVDAALGPLISGLRRALSAEIRLASEEYLEAVVTRERLESCMEILAQTLGPPVKAFDQPVALEKSLRAMVDSRGGIMKNQCLYVRKYEDGGIAFAALWPWGDGDNVTVKVGVYDPKV